MQIDVIDYGQYWMRYARYGLGLSYGLTSGKNTDDIPGELDERLTTVMKRLAGIGNGEDKFLRQIPVCYNIQAPLYWWSEMDTYKVGTTAQSESTMHSLGSVPRITQDMFERNIPDEILNELNVVLNRYRVSHSDVDFMMLKPFLAYAAGRQNNEGLKEFKTKMTCGIEAVIDGDAATEGQRFKNFCKLFEAVLAYHKAHGGK